MRRSLHQIILGVCCGLVVGGCRRPDPVIVVEPARPEQRPAEIAKVQPPPPVPPAPAPKPYEKQEAKPIKPKPIKSSKPRPPTPLVVAKSAPPLVEPLDGILQEIRLLAPAHTSGPKAGALPLFPAKALSGYARDKYKSVFGLRAQYEKNLTDFTQKYPLRAAVFDTSKALDENSKGSFPETLSGPIGPKQKAATLKSQQKLGIAIFELEQALAAMKSAADERDKEASKRWQANFDFALARLQARLIYLYEYDYMLAQIRSDSLPELAKGQNGWRLGPRATIQVTESKAKHMFKDLRKLWKKIEETYPDTPWAFFAQLDSQKPAGLEWLAKKG
jgi:hypothetical protein